MGSFSNDNLPAASERRTVERYFGNWKKCFDLQGREMTGICAEAELGDDDPPPIPSRGSSATFDASPEEKSDCSLISSSSDDSFAVAVAEIVATPASVVSKDDDLGGKFEEILDDIGGFGRYQKCVVFLIVLPAIFVNGLLGSSWLFFIATPSDFWCTIPGSNNTSAISNSVFGHNFANFRPKVQDSSAKTCGKGSNETTRQCCLYDVDYGSVLGSNYSGELHIREYLNVTKGAASLSLTTCPSGYTYDQSFLLSSIVTDFDLVCDMDILPTLGYTIPSVGGVLGVIAGGYISDKYGRKPAFFLFLVALIVLGPALALSNSFYAYLPLATLATIPTSPLYSIPYTLGLEIITPELRMTYSVLITVAFTLGGIVLVGIAYFFRYWKTILLSSTLPALFFLGYFSFMPESPRWLLSQKRFKDLHRYFRMTAKINGKPFTANIEEKFAELKSLQQGNDQSNAQSKTSFLVLFKTKTMALRTVFLSYLSFCVSTVYVGLCFYAPSLGSNPFLNLLLSSLIELPSSLLTEILTRWLGRKKTLLVCLVLGVASMLGTAGISHPDADYYQLLVLFCLARLFTTSAYTVQELIVYESFPTVVRGEAVSFITLFSYIVSSFGPLIVYFRYGDFTMPFMIFGGMTAVAVGCVLTLPETSGPLRETFDVSEEKNKRSWWRTIVVLLSVPNEKASLITKPVGV